MLQKHLDKLGHRTEVVEPVKLSDGGTGRIDLMLNKVIQPRAGEFDYLIVELKRPTKKIDDEVVTQIKKYARAVAGSLSPSRTSWMIMPKARPINGASPRASFPMTPIIMSLSGLKRGQR